jgi:tetratricopeptide (TPR) repeat protein
MFLAYAISRVARVQSMLGRLKQANQAAGEAIGLYDALIARDPSNTKWLGASMSPRAVKAGLLIRQQNWVDAEALFDDALATLAALSGDRTGNLEVNELLAGFSLMRARVARARDNNPQAIQHARMAEDHMQDFIRLERLDAERLALVASIHVIRAELHLLLGSSEQANQQLEQAQSLLTEPATTSSSPLLLDPWARLLYLPVVVKKHRWSATSSQPPATCRLNPGPSDSFESVVVDHGIRRHRNLRRRAGVVVGTVDGHLVSEFAGAVLVVRLAVLIR